ncbi:HK97 gp10 family phage protein [Stenotrophomonas forensis]|uniref:HK97 gp10 family phage protein n=1 Tax=Stenotrophomonas forensis TaxID=2871169 RepID=A0ABY7Y5T1_9GAMM|nr:HK97 gp10 family phage protein [Stenotrophomonas sp. DFS-20110405]WDM65326.1 HK97 gp10 family phage protein [Stenotrophomonas sp. DFS-20110405]
MSIKANVDFSDAVKGLEALLDSRVSLARSMAVAGGQVIRDEVKLRAPVGTEEGGSLRPGSLRDAIYLAYRDGRSTDRRQVYSISWNAKKAPHGHLVEFGHWQTHAVYKDTDGSWTLGAPLAQPEWVPAKPFVRPGYEASLTRAQAAMVERGRERLPELLREVRGGGG